MRVVVLDGDRTPVLAGLSSEVISWKFGIRFDGRGAFTLESSRPYDRPEKAMAAGRWALNRILADAKTSVL